MKRTLLLALLLIACDYDVRPNALRYAREMGYAVKGLSCMETDTNMDGWLSCTLNVDGQGPLAIECRDRHEGGCRMQAAVLRRQ